MSLITKLFSFVMASAVCESQGQVCQVNTQKAAIVEEQQKSVHINYIIASA